MGSRPAGRSRRLRHSFRWILRAPDQPATRPAGRRAGGPAHLLPRDIEGLPSDTWESRSCHGLHPVPYGARITTVYSSAAAAAGVLRGSAGATRSEPPECGRGRDRDGPPRRPPAERGGPVPTQPGPEIGDERPGLCRRASFERRSKGVRKIVELPFGTAIRQVPPTRNRCWKSQSQNATISICNG